ncbi:MAG: PEP-CTERM sorting domain-containing protein [Planctomycetota bacterium]
MPAARHIAALCLALLLATPTSAQTTDFTAWTLLEGPPDPDLSGVVAPDGTTATLSATGSINAMTDIGFASINGQDVASSNRGFYFDPNESFAIAVDYEIEIISTPTTSTVFRIGFGIGEDINGTDGAGVAVGVSATFPTPSLFFTGSASARTDDEVVSDPTVLASTGAVGSLQLAYDAATGNITVDSGPDLPPPDPTDPFAIDSSFTLSGLQNSWDNEGLIVSFFLNGVGVGFEDGDVEATFSNFRILEGTPIAIPEPAALTLLAAAAGLALTRRRA